MDTTSQSALDDQVRVEINADLSFLQLLCAAHKSAVRRGKTLTIAGAVPEDIRQKVKETGMTGNKSCGNDLGRSCLWAEV
jgi:hypothetical protein